MHVFVYQTTNTQTGKIYIGVHETNDLNDNYLGSGSALHASIRKYGISNFTRRILWKCSSIEEAYELEELIVDKEFVNRTNNYNLCIGGKGGWEGRRITQPGESNPHAKLTWELVAEIRASDKGPTELAKEYNVAKSQISRIKNNKTWKTN